MRCWMIAIILMVLATGCASAQPGERELRQLGTGVWIWNLPTLGTPEELADKAAAAGIGHVYLKAHDGIKIFRHAPSVPDYAEAFHGRGIKVLIWGYNYARHPEQEAAIIIDFLHQPYVDGYVYDTERHLEHLQLWDRVERMLKLVQAHRDGCADCRTKLLGYAPFPIPSLHRRLPYRLFTQYSDFIEPQIYWAEMRRPVRGTVVWSYNEWVAWERENGLSRPIIPLGQTYGVGSWLRPGDIVRFGQDTRGYYAVSYYLWDKTTPEGWEELAQVVRGRNGEWDRVGTSAQPLDEVTVSWVSRILTALFRFYWQGVTILLLCTLIAVTYSKWSTLWQRRWVAGIGAVLSLLWPYVLMAVGMVLAIAALVLAAVGLYRAARRHKRR